MLPAKHKLKSITCQNYIDAGDLLHSLCIVIHLPIFGVKNLKTHFRLNSLVSTVTCMFRLSYSMCQITDINWNIFPASVCRHDINLLWI